MKTKSRINSPLKLNRNISRAALLCAFASASASAQTLYLTETTGTWDYTETNWSTTPGGAGDTAWTNGNNVVLNSAATSYITVSEPDLVVADFTFAPGKAFFQRGVAGEQNQLEITGAAAGTYVVDGASASGATNTLKLSGTTAWDGQLQARAGFNNRIVIANSAAVGVNTSVRLITGGDVLLGPDLVGQTTTIGELQSSGAYGSVSANYGATGIRTLKIDQSTNTEYTGGFAAASLAGRDIALIKAGVGSLTLSGAAQHGGGVAVEGGELIFTSAVSTANQGAFTVADGATLQVDTTINFVNDAAMTVETGGTLVVGGVSDVGALTLDGGTGVGLIFGDGAIVDFRLGGTQDSIVLSGANMSGQALGGDDSIEFNFIDQGGLIEGEYYDLIEFGTTPGINIATFFSNLDGTFRYDSNMLQFGYSVIPEPSSFVLMLGAFAGMIVIARKRTRNC